MAVANTFDLIEELVTFRRDSSFEVVIRDCGPGFEIRVNDSITIRLMIAKNRVSFFTVLLGVPVEQGIPQG